ncbi:MAG: hypothetical protein R2729_22305 [Bryobacteraceae bacterium]
MRGTIWGAWWVPGESHGYVEWWAGRSFHQGVWAKREARVKVLPEGESKVGLTYLRPLDESSALGMSRGRIVKVRLPSMEVALESRVPVAANAAKVGSVVLSKARDTLAYVVEEGERSMLVLRRTSDLTVLAEIEPPMGLSFSMLPHAVAISPDGVRVVVDAYVTKTGPVLQPDSVHELVIADGLGGRIERQLAIDGRNALALSPDGSLLVAGRTIRDTARSGSYASAGIYDLRSGAELARVRHAAVTEPRDNPFAADFSGVAFDPNGRYLVTSTQHTRVWRIYREQ